MGRGEAVLDGGDQLHDPQQNEGDNRGLPRRHHQ